ncbi:hypothetical protein LINPERPRIM_LOCUS4282 [Linum perenne]
MVMSTRVGCTVDSSLQPRYIKKKVRRDFRNFNLRFKS